MQHDIGRMHELTQINPPAQLDALVRERAHCVLRSQARVVQAESRHSHPDAKAGVDQHARWPIALPAAEQWVYAAGLVVYGAQVLSSAARVLWRSVLG
jgi:hypothetical protein